MERVRPQDIQYYDHRGMRLLHTWLHKVNKILEHDCLRPTEDPTVWVCLPIIGYNIRVYTLKRIPDSQYYQCNCQGHTKRGHCSHSVALYYKNYEARSDEAE